MIRVQREAFDLGTEYNALLHGRSDIGAIACFVGLVRDFAETSDGRKSVSVLELEHYPTMAEKQLATIEQEAVTRFHLDASLIIHRYGRLMAGESIVLVIAAAAHRQAALDATAFLMDWLKTRAPFWKVEERSDGNHLIAAKSSDEAARNRW